MLRASKTPDESGNYNHSVRVTYRLGIRMKYARIRRGEVPSTNGLGNPTPMKNLRFDSYTDSKTKCDTLPKTPDESGNYNHSVRVTYRLGIRMKYARNRRARFPRPMDWETQPLRKILGLILIRIQKLNVTRFQKRPMNRATTITRYV